VGLNGNEIRPLTFSVDAHY